MSDAAGNLNGRWAEGSQSASATSKGINSNFFDIEFNVNPGYTSMQLLAAIKQNTFRRLVDDIGQECTPDTYHHRIIFMSMVMDKIHRNDKANLHNAQRPCDFAARFRPGYWVSLDSGSEGKWKHDRWLTEKKKSCATVASRASPSPRLGLRRLQSV